MPRSLWPFNKEEGFVRVAERDAHPQMQQTRRAGATALRLTLCLTLLVPIAGGCQDGPADNRAEAMTTAASDIAQVLERHTDELMSLPGVVGVGQSSCDGDPCILVLVVERTPQLEKNIPSALEGYAVVIKVTGEIRAEPDD